MSLRLMSLIVTVSFVQVTLVPLLFLDPWSAPLLPVALVAAWSVNRSQDEAWPALLPSALLLGVLSTQRVGWFLVALLPVALAGAAMAQTQADKEQRLLWRLPATASVAGLGTLGYLLTLAIVSDELIALAAAAPAVVCSVLGSSALATTLTPLLRPRRRRHGLFT
jgi:hypothetical protein